MGKYVNYLEIASLIEQEKNKGRSIVLTGGCFDLLHEGHLAHLYGCKKYGDILVVNVVNDKRVKIHKGNSRPINNENRRAKIIGALEVVDYSTVYPSVDLGPTTELALIIRPDFVVQSKEAWERTDSSGLQKILGNKTRLINLRRSSHKVSTTSIINQIKAEM